MADQEFGLELVDADGEEPSGEALAELAALAEAEAVDGRVRGAGGGTDRVAGALEAERAVLREDVALFASGHPGDAVVVRVI